MRHQHEDVRGTSFTISYEHEDSSLWHVAKADEDHDHPLAVVVLGGKFEVPFEGQPGDMFHHEALM